MIRCNDQKFHNTLWIVTYSLSIVAFVLFSLLFCVSADFRILHFTWVFSLPLLFLCISWASSTLTVCAVITLIKKNYNPNKLFTHWLRTEMYVSLITPQLERLFLLSLLVFFSPLSNNPIFFLSNCAQVTARQSRCVEKSLEKLI